MHTLENSILKFIKTHQKFPSCVSWCFISDILVWIFLAIKQFMRSEIFPLWYLPEITLFSWSFSNVAVFSWETANLGRAVKSSNDESVQMWHNNQNNQHRHKIWHNNAPSHCLNFRHNFMQMTHGEQQTSRQWDPPVAD